MDFPNLGFLDQALLSTLHDMMDISDEIPEAADRKQHAPSRAYVRDKKAMARTPVDVKEYPNAFKFVVDMPGVSPGEVKVQLDENDGVLVVSAERRREKEGGEEGMKYLKMERRMGKFMRKFPLPENANKEAISAVCRDGVVTVTVEKLPPPEPKKPKTVRVQVG